MTQEEINEMCKDNFDEKNIESISKQIEKEHNNNSNQKVLRMINNSSGPCNVTITEQSRKKCAQSLIR